MLNEKGFDNLFNEGGDGYNPYRAEREQKIYQLQVELAELERVENKKFLSEWTVSVTQERRTEWNAMVRSGKFGKTGSGKVNWNILREQEKVQGWTMDDMKKAVNLNGL